MTTTVLAKCVGGKTPDRRRDRWGVHRHRDVRHRDDDDVRYRGDDVRGRDLGKRTRAGICTLRSSFALVRFGFQFRDRG